MELPAFRRQFPASWFVRAEARLLVEGVTSQERMCQLLQREIPAEVLRQLDLPPRHARPFDALKAAYCQFFKLALPDYPDVVYDACPLTVPLPQEGGLPSSEGRLPAPRTRSRGHLHFFRPSLGLPTSHVVPCFGPFQDS